MRPDSALALDPFGIALFVLIAIVYPLIGLYRYRRIEHLPEPLPSKTRLRIYYSLIVSQWTLVALVVLFFANAGRSLAELGQSLGPRPMGTLVTAGTVLAAFGVLSLFTTQQLKGASPSDLPRRMRRAGKILPQTGEERTWFALVALTAGVCEEILYRGFVPWAVAGWTGHVLLGFALAAIVFGLGHAYQGKDGMIVTGILGLFFGALAYFVKSLVPGQLLHIAIDLVNGIAVGATLARARLAPVPVPPLEAAPADVDAPAAPSA
jgi:membrane protease YdiL (CAAX protease family)